MDGTDILNLAASRQTKKYAEPATGHVSLGTSLRFILFLIPAVLLALVLFLILRLPPEVSVPVQILGTILIIVVVSGIRVAAEWERGVVLRLGKFQGLKGPGVMYILPFIEYIRFIDVRVLAINIPSQKVITRDNVPAQIDGALFFRVEDAEKAVIRIQDFQFAISQFAQASLRDVVGGLTLDELLTEREQIQEQIGKVVEERIREWGIHLDSVRLLDVEMPEDLKRMMSRQASAEREKRANITKAEGDKLAAANLAEAARIMLESPGAIQLRTLQTVDGLGPTPSNTVILFPAELSDALRGFVDSIVKK
ncbi:MAG: slipin family protein [Ignavibacteria bacterium]|jgi:uncharacterized membrane protein YqiK|nr:slipin family protein [Ignavibacteria bacterium]MCU7503489.1 slipin family protein [Ignavibacteria bacterium]MCU7516179.1 slipin family protein [Ignavibacteria bacterium]